MKSFQLDIHVSEDDEQIRDLLRECLTREGHRVSTSSNLEEIREALQGPTPDVMLLDVFLGDTNMLYHVEELRTAGPGMVMVMMSGQGTMDIVISALRAGVDDFLKKPISIHDLKAAIQKAANLKAHFERQARLLQTIENLDRKQAEQSEGICLLGPDPETEKVRRGLTLAAEKQVKTLLILGETGTGKEVAARQYHRLARSQDKPFIALNCPAIPSELIESELFGHVKGSFTGAGSNRKGAFELAEGGTLFLDEISELSPAAQAKLLRALETRRIRRVGDHKDFPVDVNVVAAANQDLQELMKTGRFRADLFFRLNLFPVMIKPLRRRQGDILPLARHFLNRNSRNGSHFNLTPDAEQALLSYHYPGNVRELRNIIERAVILSDNGHIPSSLLMLTSKGPSRNPPHPEPSETMGAVGSDLPKEATAVLEALESCLWNRREAAKKLGISYEALRWRIQKYQIGRR